jgi:aryl-alcohol dehydrogenase-like predicted oxidoreductase
MRFAEFRPLGRSTSRIGLGCGRLVGRSSARESARLVEAAIDLGIRYFDVAPSYGLGTAEEVVGAVIGNSKDVVVATKVGVPRPAYSERANAIRRLAKPILDRVRVLKGLAQGIVRRSARPSGERPRYDFSAAGIRASLEESLQKLRRPAVDVFLAHEPHPEDLRSEVVARFEALRAEGLIAAYGVGIAAVGDRWEPFGSIWQSCWPGGSASGYAQDVEHVWHGAIRWREAEAGGRRLPAGTVVRRVLDASPTSILLVSASTPARLRELLRDVDP